MPDLSPVILPESVLVADTPQNEVPTSVYLDYMASTPCDPEVVALMQRLTLESFANASSFHPEGRRAARCIERARGQVAAGIDALPEEIIFTSGATESNNLAILGVAAAARDAGIRRRRMLTLALEHPSVLQPMAELRRRGFEVEFVPLDGDGRVSLDALEEKLDGALLLSIQAANNEVGTLQPLAEASQMAAQRGVLVHSDAAQILGKAPFSVEDLALDFASVSAHKCYGPKGVGALWVRGGVARAPIRPITFGGGHEAGLRPGTPNAPAIAGFGHAVLLSMRRYRRDREHVAAMRDYFEELLKSTVSPLQINGAGSRRLPGATSLTFKGLDADALVANLRDLCLSTASACHAGTPEPSHVLRAIGFSSDEAFATLRVGLGRLTTRAEVVYAAERLAAGVALQRSLRKAAPSQGRA